MIGALEVRARSEELEQSAVLCCCSFDFESSTILSLSQLCLLHNCAREYTAVEFEVQLS